MLTPERLNILQRASEKAKYSALHDNIHPPPMVTMVTMGGDLQPGCLAGRLLTGLGQPQINL